MTDRETGRGKRTRQPRQIRQAEPTPIRPPREAADPERLLDSLDEAMLAQDAEGVHALMEQLWAVRRRLPDALAQRLIDGRARVPQLAFDLLAGFAGPRARTHLRRIGADPAAHDIVRFGAQRRAGWPERGEAKRRRAFLDALSDPEGTLVVALDQGTGTWPPNGEIVQEVLGYLVALPSERRRAVVERAADELGERAAWLLHALLHVDDPATQRLAIARLTEWREQGATGPLERLTRTTRDDELRAEARAAAQRVRLRVVGGPHAGEPLPLPPVERVLISALDGDGGQVIVVARQLGEGVYLVADFFHNEAFGLKDTFGLSPGTPDQLEELEEGFGGEGIALVEVDLAAARGALAGAVETNAATGHPLPPVFELWEPLVHESYPPPADEPVVATELDDAPYAGRHDLLRAGGRLLEHPFFFSWMFDSEEVLPLLDDVPPPRGGRWGERQYRPLLEALATPALCARLRQRLRRQAWLLEHVGAHAERDAALATAAALGDAEPATLAKLPFLREMLKLSVGASLGLLLFDAW